MKVTFSPFSDAIYIDFTDGADMGISTNTESFFGERTPIDLQLNVNSSGVIMGIEIQGASGVLPKWIIEGAEVRLREQ